MKNITKVISSIVGIVGTLAGISALTACSAEEEPTPVKYGPLPSPYAQCDAADDYNACADCCRTAKDPYTCIEDYVKNGICSEAVPDYGPQPYDPVDPVYGPPEQY